MCMYQLHCTAKRILQNVYLLITQQQLLIIIIIIKNKKATKGGELGNHQRKGNWETTVGLVHEGRGCTDALRHYGTYCRILGMASSAQSPDLFRPWSGGASSPLMRRRKAERTAAKGNSISPRPPSPASQA